jgi:hypothetical protein
MVIQRLAVTDRPGSLTRSTRVGSKRVPDLVKWPPGAYCAAKLAAHPIVPALGTRRQTMPHGKICYLEIPANRADDAAAFYSNIFGWTVRQRGDGNLAFDDSGSVSGTWVKEEDRTPDERTRVYIMVDTSGTQGFQSSHVPWASAGFFVQCARRLTAA